MRIAFPILVAGLLLAGCRSVSPAAPEGPIRPGEILSTRTGRSVSFEEMMHEVRGDRAVYVGEQHDNDHMHAFEADVVRAMYRQDPRLMIGMEMFQRPFQDALDRFVRGEIDEETMLRETKYHERWGWDYHYYRPMLLFAREHGLRVIALNAPPDARRKLARDGRDALTDEEKAWVAEEVDTGDEKHREAFVNAVGGGGHAMSAGFESMYKSQCIWEDTMAESAARALAAAPDHRIAVVAGGFHVQRFSIPGRAARRGAKPYAILNGATTRVTRKDLPDVLDPDEGDWIYFTLPSPSVAPTPKLGVRLEEPTEAGLPVVEAVKGSLAALAGVKAGDVITGLNGRKIADLTDLKIALTLMEDRVGTISVLRDGTAKELVFDRAWAAP